MNGDSREGPGPGSRVALHAALVVACALPFGCAPEAPGPLAGAYPRHNVVLISVDTLRADHLGAYGYTRPTSPMIDAIARQSVLFERAFAPVAATWPSLASLLTARRPHNTNVRANGELLADDVPTLATVLGERGWTTASFVANACEAFTRGFDARACAKDPVVSTRATAWLAEAPPEPFFLWLHYLAPHEEYRPPPDFDLFTRADYDGPFDGNRREVNRATLGEVSMSDADREQVIALYDGEIRFTDALISQVWQTLERRELLEKTLVVVTADHGEELGDHHGYFYHICSVHEPALHIPLMIRLPDGRHAGARVEGLVENIDVVPTLLALLGEPLPSDLDGTSLLPHMEASPPESRRAVSEFYRPGLDPILSVRTDRWRYVYNPGNTTPRCLPLGDFYEVAEEELYDHGDDPLERRSVAAEHPDIVAGLRAEATATYQAKRSGPAIHAHPETMENLRALGYVVE